MEEDNEELAQGSSSLLGDGMAQQTRIQMREVGHLLLSWQHEVGYASEWPRTWQEPEVSSSLSH